MADNKECTWQPEKHNGEECPTHKGKGAGAEKRGTNFDKGVEGAWKDMVDKKTESPRKEWWEDMIEEKPESQKRKMWEENLKDLKEEYDSLNRAYQNYVNYGLVKSDRAKYIKKGLVSTKEAIDNLEMKLKNK